MSARKKTTRKRSKARASAGSRTKSAAKKPTRKKPAERRRGKPTTSKASRPRRRRASIKDRPAPRFSRQGLGAGAAGQSGDLQGLSRREDVDSESVEELLEEGNTLEAGVVSGVEEADSADEREVRTREVPEDDVPEEYLDKDW